MKNLHIHKKIKIIFLKKNKKSVLSSQKIKRIYYIYNLNITLWHADAFLIVHGKTTFFYIIKIQIGVIFFDGF